MAKFRRRVVEGVGGVSGSGARWRWCRRRPRRTTVDGVSQGPAAVVGHQNTNKDRLVPPAQQQTPKQLVKKKTPKHCSCCLLPSLVNNKQTKKKQLLPSSLQKRKKEKKNSPIEMQSCWGNPRLSAKLRSYLSRILIRCDNKTTAF